VHQPEGDLVRIEHDGVLTVTFSRDHKLNAVNAKMIDGLRIAVDDLAERDDLRVMVIAAKGRYFTAGIDINEMPVGGLDREPSGVRFRHEYSRLHRFFDDLEAVEKPVILAAHGPCLGFGVEMGLSCDFRLAAARASFSLPEIRNLAALPGSGGISRLTRMVGPHWARWLAMAGQTMDAQQALSAGLVHAVYRDEEFHEAVSAFARDLVSQSSEALALAKITIDAAVSADRRSARDFDRVADHFLVNTAQHRAKVEEFRRRSERRTE
jgi:enoyl-CoA hydratase